MLKSILLSTILLFSINAFSKSCAEQDTLFDANESFLCEADSGQKVCINFGYHSMVELDGMRIFNDGNPSGTNDHMIFQDPVWHNCVLSVFKACTNEYVKETGYGYKAYRKRAPDVWDARSSETRFKLFVEDGYAKLNILGYNTSGELSSDTTYEYRNCQLQD